MQQRRLLFTNQQWSYLNNIPYNARALITFYVHTYIHTLATLRLGVVAVILDVTAKWTDGMYIHTSEHGISMFRCVNMKREHISIDRAMAVQVSSVQSAVNE